MKSTITHGNQQRLDEEEHLPRRNGEAVDKVEAENGRFDHPAGNAGAACDERAETYEHDQEKAGARGAVEPTISFHFAPARGLPWDLLNFEDSGEGTMRTTGCRQTFVTISQAIVTNVALSTSAVCQAWEAGSEFARPPARTCTASPMSVNRGATVHLVAVICGVCSLIFPE